MHTRCLLALCLCLALTPPAWATRIHPRVATSEESAIAFLQWALPTFLLTSSGRGEASTRIGITEEGFVRVWEAPIGVRHVGTDGYAFCTAEGPLASSIGQGSPVNFAPPEIAQPDGDNTFPFTVTRTTADGVLRFVQRFTWSPRTQELRLQMTVTNLSGTTLHALRLTRSFHAWPDVELGDQVGEVIVAPKAVMQSGADSLWAWAYHVPQTHAMSLTVGTPLVPHTALIVDTNAWWYDEEGTRCGGFDATPGPTPPGYWIGLMRFDLGPLHPGKSKTMQLLYRRF